MMKNRLRNIVSPLTPLSLPLSHDILQNKREKITKTCVNAPFLFISLVVCVFGSFLREIDGEEKSLCAFSCETEEILSLH